MMTAPRDRVAPPMTLLYSAPAFRNSHSCSRSPSSPRGWSGLSFLAAMKPSGDMLMLITIFPTWRRPFSAKVLFASRVRRGPRSSRHQAQLGHELKLIDVGVFRRNQAVLESQDGRRTQRDA